MQSIWTAYQVPLWTSKSRLRYLHKTRDKWATDIDFADEQYKFTLADLDMDGQVELLVSHSGGT